MELTDVRAFLRTQIQQEAETYFGCNDEALIDRITEGWFNDRANLDGRWQKILARVAVPGKVLDMAAGCGTFVLFGLHNGYDVWGVEPEDWKREFYQQKITVSNYSPDFSRRILAAVGEALPFEDESFDLVTTYQTLEHVQDVNQCLQEMLRVLKPGGVLYIKAPDYNCFFEPHYRVPFLPRMNKTWATWYLKRLNKPIKGLQTLQWTTEKGVVNCLKNSQYSLKIERMAEYYSNLRQEKIRTVLPGFLKTPYVVKPLSTMYYSAKQLNRIKRIGREEKHIDLWVTKLK